jgi:hypothetical protein
MEILGLLHIGVICAVLLVGGDIGLHSEYGVQQHVQIVVDQHLPAQQVPARCRVVRVAILTLAIVVV